MVAVAGYLQAFSLDSTDALFTASWKWRVEPVHSATLVLVSPRRYKGGAEVSVTPADQFHVAWDQERVRPPFWPSRRGAGGTHRPRGRRCFARARTL